MKTVEDALECMFDFMIHEQAGFIETGLDTWYVNFLGNVYEHVGQRKPLSSEQARIILKILSRLRRQLVEHGFASGDGIDRLLLQPVYRSEPYQSSNIPREVRYIGDNCLAFRYKFNDVITAALKSIGKKGQYFYQDGSRFDHGARCWVVRVTRDTINPIFEIINTHRFKFDDDTLEYLTLASNSKNQKSIFEFDPDSGKIVANVCDNEIIASWISNVLGGEMM